MKSKSSKQKETNYDEQVIDTLKYLFRDISEIPILAGYADYLPLTRRIERGKHLLSYQKDESALMATQTAIRDCLKELNEVLAQELVAMINPELHGDLDSFLDDPGMSQPPLVELLLRGISDTEIIDSVRENAWMLSYMFSVLPSVVRSEWDSIQINPVIISRFSDLRSEVKRCKHDVVQGTLRYAINIARLYLDEPVPFPDLIQQGFIGLMHAAEKYQEHRMTHFQHYASNWIRQQIGRYISDHSRIIRIPVHLEAEVNQIDNVIHKHRDTYGFEPSETDIYLGMGWLDEDDILAFRALNDQQRYEDIEGIFRHLRSIMEMAELPSSQVTERVANLIEKIDVIAEKYEDRVGRQPTEEFILQKLEWLTSEDIRFRRTFATSAKVSKRRKESARTHLQKAQRRMQYYRMAHAKHYSIEDTEILLNGQSLELRDILPAFDDVAADGDLSLLSAQIAEIMQEYLKPREIEIINKRFGLADGREYTLEEIGSELGVTRERIRQLESKALRTLARRKDLLANTLNTMSYTTYQVNVLTEEVYRSLGNTRDRVETSKQDLQSMKKRIEFLIDNYIERGRPRRMRGAKARHTYIEEVLKEAGNPLHHKEIHKRVLEIIPDDRKITEKSNYAALFYSDKFQSLGEGVFALTTWVEENYQSTGKSGKISHFPEPLRPIDQSTTAFFESIMVGRHILQKPQTVLQFVDQMMQWANQEKSDVADIQNALDAWYAAGLINRISFNQQSDEMIELTLIPDAKMNEVRMICLNNLVQRVAKMSELLLTLKHIAPAGLTDIQKILFGGPGAGFDVPTRLEVLVSFEAVQKEGSQWRLTSVGEQVLNENPPDELPDFSVIEEFIEEDDDQDLMSWEDDLGLLET